MSDQHPGYGPPPPDGPQGPPTYGPPGSGTPPTVPPNGGPPSGSVPLGGWPAGEPTSETRPWSGSPDVLAPPPQEVTPRKPRTKAVLTAMAGVLVVATLGFGIASLSEGDGADSAEEAVQDLFDAIDRQDAIGVAESLEPSERKVLVTALKETSKQAKRVKVADDGLDLKSVAGVDLTVSHLQMHAQALDDETTAVDIDSGQISSRAQLSKMPIGPVIQEVIDRNEDAGERVDDTETDQIDLTGTRIVAVERGGRWYVSALYSVAEQVRLDTDPVPAYPRPGTAIPAVGAASPEAAVREGIDAAVKADVRRLIELTPEDEARVLHTYGPILVDNAKGMETDIEVSDLNLEVDNAPGGRKRVRATSMTMTWEDEWERQTITYDGKCSTTKWELTDPDEYDESDTNGSWKFCDDDLLAFAPFGFFLVFYSPASLDVIVEQHDGSWFLSPSSTVLANTVGTFDRLDDDAVRRIARSWSGEWWIDYPKELWEACGVEQPTLDTSRTDGERAWEQCMQDLPDDYDGPWGPFGSGSSIGRSESGSDSSFPSYPGDECYYTASGDSLTEEETVACLEDLVAAGEIPASELAAFQCESVYDDIPDEGITEDQLDELWAKADEAYDACIDAAESGTPGGSGGGSSFGGGATPSTTTPNVTTTTRPPSTTTTTTPPATTSTTTN